MSTAEARGHNFKGRTGAPRGAKLAALEVKKVACCDCGDLMRVAVRESTGEPWEHCFSCGVKRGLWNEKGKML